MTTDTCVCGHPHHEAMCAEIISRGGYDYTCPCTHFVAQRITIVADAPPLPPDSVHRPAHYTRFANNVQPIDLIEQLPYNLGAAIKYLARAGYKGSAAEDLRKARWHIDRELARLAGEG